MADLIIRIGATSDAFQDELDGIKKQTKNLEGQLASIAKVSAVAFVGLAGSIALAVREAAKMEAIEAQFITLTGSITKASKALGELQNFAATTPFQFEDIAKAGKQLLGFQFTAEQLIPTLQSIGDVAAAMGANFGEVNLIFGQVRAAGKLTGERLLQLQERAIPIGPALAKTLGVAESAVKDLVSRGKVDFAIFEKAFKSLSEEGGAAFGGMARQSKTLEGQISTLKDNFALFSAEIGKKFLPIVKAGVSALIGLFEVIRENRIIARTTALFLGLGAGLTGLVTVLTTGALAFIAIRNAMIAANISAAALTLGIKGLIAATGLGLLVIVLAEVLAAWETLWPVIAATAETALTRLTNFFVGFGKIMLAVFTFDTKLFLKGLDQLQEAFMASLDDFQDNLNKRVLKIPAPEFAKGLGDIAGKAFAEREGTKTEILTEEAKKRIRIIQDELEVQRAINAGGDQEEIALLRQKLSLKRDEEEIALIGNQELRAAETELIQENQLTQLEDEAEFKLVQLEQEMEANLLFSELDDISQAKKIQLQEQFKNTDQETRKILLQNLKSFNKQKEALDEQSANSAIGFAAAVGDAIIAIEGDNFFAGLALQKVFAVAGIFIEDARARASSLAAGAAAAAFAGPAAPAVFAAVVAGMQATITANTALSLGIVAAQTVGQVARAKRSGRAQKGGRVDNISGGAQGDTQPFFLEVGEFITPRDNFEEVINATAQARIDSGQTVTGDTQSAPSTEFVFKLMEPLDQFIELIETRIVRNNKQGTGVGIG